MTINPQLDNIPPELRQHKAWLVWRYEANKDPGKKPLKVPYYALTGRRRAGAQGSAADRGDLVSFEEAVSVFRNRRGYYTGIGFATLAEWGVVGLDFDNCVSEDGAVDSQVLEVVGTTYSEVSPSGKGVRAFVMGRLPDRKSVGVAAAAAGGGKGFGFETFHTKGFLTVTGAVTDVYDLAGVGVEPLDVGVGELFESRFGSARLAWEAEKARAARLAAAGESGTGVGGAGTGLQSVLELGVLTSALRAIADAVNAGKQEMGRNTWRDVLYGVGEATGWSAEGWEVAHEFSRAVPDYGPEALDVIWEGAARKAVEGSDGGGAKITDASVRHMARKWGWVDPTLAIDVSAFEEIPFDTRPVPEGGAGGVEARGAGGEVATRVNPDAGLGKSDGGRGVALVDDDLPLELPAFDRERSGAIKPTVTNTVAAVRRADLCGLRVGYDDFRDDITVSRDGVDEWRAMTDADAVSIRMRLESLGFKTAPKETCRDAVVLVAAENRYDSAQLWLGGLQWDGVPRVETFLIRYLGCEDTPYTRAVAMYLWTALAGRTLVPGVKADMVPIFEGDQGLRKSSAIEALAPAQEFFVEIDLEEKEADTVRKLRGALVGEIAELSGLHTRALEAIKKFVVRKTEKWVPKFKEFSSTFQRRLVFIGTTNRTDILADETGNRRWLPLHITAADIEGIVAARDQLWAEGAELFRRSGVAWQDAERLAVVEGGAHDRYSVEDSWDGLVAAWLDAPEPFDALVDRDGVVTGQPRGDSPITVADVLIGALKFAPGQIDMRSQKRMGAVLRSLGYVKVVRREGGRNTKFWVRDNLS